MAITVSCESCGVSYRVDDSAGKSGNCKQCGSTLRLPTTAAPPPLTKPSPILAPPQIVPIPAQPIGYPPTDVYPVVPQSPQMMPATSGPNWKLIITLVVLGLVLIGGGIFVVVSAVSAVKQAAQDVRNRAAAAATQAAAQSNRPATRQSSEKTPINRPQNSARPATRPATVRPVTPSTPSRGPATDLGELKPDPSAALPRSARFGPFTVALPDTSPTAVRDVAVTNGRATFPVFVAKHQLTVVFQIEPRIDRNVDKPAASIAPEAPPGTQKLWSPRATSAGYGRINGRTFARIERALGTRTQIQYAAFVDDHYVTIQLNFPTGNEDARTLGEAIAQSLR